MNEEQLNVISAKVLELVKQGRCKEAEPLLTLDVADHLNERIDAIPMFERLEALAGSL